VRWERILPAVAVLCAMWASLPVRLARSSAAPSDEDCLTLSDPDSARGARPRAIDLLERCSTLYPRDVEILADLGAAHESDGDATGAEELYQRALVIDPAYAELRLRLGRLMLRRGAREAAEAQAVAALQVQPNRQGLLDLLRDTRAATPGAPR
jgi:tetratricopeptide (TPR) repeat protein